MTKTRSKRRFRGGAKVRIINPGTIGVVQQGSDEPESLGEYWHKIKTEFGEQDEPGCNLELIPTAQG